MLRGVLPPGSSCSKMHYSLLSAFNTHVPWELTPSTSLNHFNTARNKWLFWMHCFAGKSLTVSGFVCSFWFSPVPIPIQLDAPSPAAALCVLSIAELLLHMCYAASQKLEWSLQQKSLQKLLKVAAEKLKKDRSPSRAGTVSLQFPSTCGNDKSRLLQCDRATQPMTKSSRDFLL